MQIFVLRFSLKNLTKRENPLKCKREELYSLFSTISATLFAKLRGGTRSHERKEENLRDYDNFCVRPCTEKYIPYYFEPAPTLKFWNSVKKLFLCYCKKSNSCAVFNTLLANGGRGKREEERGVRVYSFKTLSCMDKLYIQYIVCTMKRK